MMTTRIIGVMGAMTEETERIEALLTDRAERSIGGRVYHTGSLHGQRAVVVFSRWGKTAAAATVTTLILAFGVTEVIFTGVAGAIDPALAIGDIVVATRLAQHDMDARPLMPRHEIPLLGKTWFNTDEALRGAAIAAVSNMLEQRRLHEVIDEVELARFCVTAPRLHTGDIASGDKFFAADEDKRALLARMPGMLCVEMEGAAVAQVCYEYGVPFVVIRVISDIADHHSAIDFPAFINAISSRYAARIVSDFVQLDNSAISEIIPVC